MFDISMKLDRGIAVIALRGEFDLAEKERAQGIVNDALGDNAHVVMDLTGLSFIDSAGIEVLIEAIKGAMKKSLSVAFVVDENDYILRKLKELGLFDGLGVGFFGSVEEATTSIS